MEDVKKAGYVFLIIGAIAQIGAGIGAISALRGVWWSWLVLLSYLIVVILLTTFTFINYESHPLVWSILALLFVSIVGGILLIIGFANDPNVTNKKYYKLQNIKVAEDVDKVTTFDPKEYVSFQFRHGYISKAAYDIVLIELEKDNSKVIDTSDLDSYQKSLAKVELLVKLENSQINKETYDNEIAKLS